MGLSYTVTTMLNVTLVLLVVVISVLLVILSREQNALGMARVPVRHKRKE